MKRLLSIRSKESKQKGSSLVETALIAVVLIGFTGAAIDLGLIVYRYGLLNYITASQTRKAAATSCLSMSAQTRDELARDEIAREADRLLGPNLLSHVEATVVSGGVLYPTLQVKAVLNNRSFFPLLLPKALTITTKNEALIEGDEPCL